ncbi:MAG: sugar transferase [Candidatus Omnitrophica bacterium]|nr:sugar transferase [Candidatus Omnitrophota bacterium]
MSYFIVKRIFDFNLALFGLILFSPLIAVIVVLILLEDGPPVLYIKKSLGKNGRILNALKFRSMEENSLAITKVGKLLRQTAMDELPQLINIAKGEMSFVGPRNYSINKYGIAEDALGKMINPQNLNSDIVNFSKRLKVMPGLTGLAQICAPKHASDEEVLRLDLQYIKNRNFIFDLRLIFMSIWITFRKKWEDTSRKI